jgi:dienelactone hydrolase
MRRVVALLVLGAAPLAAQAPGVTAREVTVGAAPALPGTLLLPAGHATGPAVVLVHGSGPHDRDESVGATKPFRDLALGLAARGVAVLRYEKRTRVAPFSFIGRRYTVDAEVVDDAVAAVALLRAEPRIDGRRVVVVGHSLGGMLAPRIAARDGGLAGIAILAGATTRSLVAMVDDQLAYLAALPDADTAALAASRRSFAAIGQRIAALTPGDTLDTAPIGGAPPSYWYDLSRYDMAATLRPQRLPVLLMQGGRDYQVTLADLDAFLAALGPRRDLMVKRYAALDHLFVPGEGASRPSDYDRGGFVDVQVIDDLAAWVKRRSPARP